MSPLRPSVTGLLASVLVLAAPITAQPTAGAEVADPTSVSFRVVQRDGSVVANPIVAVSVFGRTYSSPRILSGSSLGQVVVPLPTDDPVAAERLAAGQHVDLMIRVFDRPPGSENINSAYVTASVGFDLEGVLRELTNASGTTVQLVPGRTAFRVAPPGVALDPTTGSIAAADPYGEPACPPSPNGAPYYCEVSDLPPWAYDTRVPVALNHGAGNEMESFLRYNSTVVTTTSTAVQIGTNSFFEAGGASAYTTNRTGGVTFSTRTPNNAAIAYLETIFSRTRNGMCMYISGTWQCQTEAVYRPHWADGAIEEPITLDQDDLDPETDCYRPVSGRWEAGEKSIERHSFSLRLGPSENWGPVSEGLLYANTTTTQQTVTGFGYVRGWRVVDNPSYDYHWVYVPNRLPARAGLKLDNPSCVGAFVGEVRTQASNVDYRAARDLEEASPHVPPVPDPPDSGEPPRTVCGRMPDKCD